MTGKRNDLRSIFGILIILSFMLPLAGCGASSSTTRQPSNNPVAPPTGEENSPAISSQPVAWNSDGTVSDNEYTRMDKLGAIECFTRLDGSIIRIALRSQNNGFLALGIKPEFRMQGADMIICALEGGQAKIHDAFSTGAFGPHPDDTQLGGTSDITDPSGTRKDGWTVFEFSRLLNTGDSRDKELTAGDNRIIWSVGSSDNISIQHNNRGSATLVLK